MTDAIAIPTERVKKTRHLPWITTPVLLVVLLLVWHLYTAYSGISAFILPPPLKVWQVWVGMLSSPRAWSHTLTTVTSTLLGFFFGMFIGVALGLVIGRIR